VLLLFQPADDALLGVLHAQAIERDGFVPRVAADTLTCEGQFGRGAIGTAIDRRDFEAELCGELEVALVVGRHRHDGAFAVAHEHVVGDEDRDALAAHRVDRVRAGEDAGFRFRFGLTIDVALGLGVALVRLDGMRR